jgi:inner membrane protein
MLLITGVAADLDSLSYFGGPAVFLRFHRTLLHSLVGSLSLALVTAATFLVLANTRQSKHPPGIQTARQPGIGAGLVALVCVIGASSHILLDLGSGIGIQLFWPFRAGWQGWELLTNIDPWILTLLAAAFLLPELLKLVSDEIGEQKKSLHGRGAAIVALVILVLYIGSRAAFHTQAVTLLASREYHGSPPLAVVALPFAATPFTWRGVVTTDATVEELPVSLLGGSDFDPDRTLTRYKAEPSDALDAGLRTSEAKAFLAYAKIPFASIIRMENGYRFELRDMRFPLDDSNPENMLARVEFNSSLQLLREELRYASSNGR